MISMYQSNRVDQYRARRYRLPNLTARSPSAPGRPSVDQPHRRRVGNEHGSDLLCAKRDAFAFSSVVAGPMSDWVVQHVHIASLDGWGWPFAIEGVPTILARLPVLRHPGRFAFRGEIRMEREDTLHRRVVLLGPILFSIAARQLLSGGA